MPDNILHKPSPHVKSMSEFRILTNGEAKSGLNIDVPGNGKEGLDKLLSLPQPLAGQAA